MRGSLYIQDYSGHVEIKWDNDLIDIDLAPKGHEKANSQEKNKVLKIVQMAILSGFTGEFFDSPNGAPTGILQEIKSLPTWCRRILLKKDAQCVKKIIESTIKTDLISPLLVVKIDKHGNGEVVQKSQFVADGEHVCVAPQSGG